MKNKGKSGRELIPAADPWNAKSLALSFLLVFLFYYLVAIQTHPPVGLWQDDGIYLSTAQSLALGSGYRHIEISSQPLQTKYPILYPALLAVASCIFREYPGNMPLLLLPTCLAAAGMMVVFALYIHRVLGGGRSPVLWCSILAAASPAVVSLVRFTMSDLLFGLFSISALLVLDLKYFASAAGPKRVYWLVGSALLVALSMLTRSFGLALAAAVLCTLSFRRQFRAAALFLLIIVLCLAPWWVWQSSAINANGPLHVLRLEAPDLSYSLWLPDNVGQTLRVMQQNLLKTVFGIGYFQLAFPPQYTFDAITSVSWHTILLYLAFGGFIVLVFTGFVASARQQWQTVHIYAPLYMLLLLVWPFEPYRFLVPWTPWLLYLLLAGMRIVSIRVGSLYTTTLPPWITAVPAWVLYTLLAALFVAEDSRLVASTDTHFYLREFLPNLSEMREADDWVRVHTTNRDVIASDRPAGLFLATGRRGQYFWPDSNPYAVYYGEDRDWRNFYFLSSNSETQYVYAEMRRNLSSTYAGARVNYYIEHAGANIQTDALAQIIAENPRWFELQYATAQGTYRIYHITWPSRSPHPGAGVLHQRDWDPMDQVCAR